MEPFYQHQYTEPKSRNIMSEAIIKKIAEAKEKHKKGEVVFDHEQGDRHLFEWLEEHLERAKGRKHNDVLIHLATIGKAMEERPDETIKLTINDKEVRIALFLARVFEDIGTIWYLQDLSMTTLRKTKQKELKRIEQEIKSQKNKRPREEEETEVPQKKTKFAEFEVDFEFEKWLDGENEFLEGLGREA